MQRIKGYHAHVYYDAATMEQARALCEEAARLFPVTMGRMHQKPVGPHPDWSCQLAFGPEVVGVVLPWLALYRKGLVVFLHPLTGMSWRITGIMRSGWGRAATGLVDIRMKGRFAAIAGYRQPRER